MGKARQEFFKTDYPGVFFRIAERAVTGEPERIYYVRYKRAHKAYFEPVGRQFQNAMTPARANNIRSSRIDGKELSNKEHRQHLQAVRDADLNKWTIDRLWEKYKALKPQKENKNKISPELHKNGKAVKAEKPDYKSFAQDQSRYVKYLKDAFSGKEPKELILLDIDRLRIKLLKKMKPQTVKHILTLLRRIIKFGVDKGLCDGIKFKIEVPRVDNIFTETLTPAQIKQLITTCNESDNKQVANLVLAALFTGMRRGELFKLEWCDIDFDKGFITIRKPKGRVTEKIPFNDLARGVLVNHPRTGSPFVFPGKDGSQRTDIKKAIAKIRTDAKLPAGFRPLHGLRHTFASMLASSGQVDMYTLQKLLTHKSPAMTQRYAHLHDDTLKNGAVVAGNLINEAMKKPADNVIEIEKPIG